MSEETERRALSIPQSPQSALSFFDAMHPEEASKRSVGSRSLGGHAFLRKLEALGLVHRTQGSAPSLDTFQAIDAAEIFEPHPAPPEMPPAPPELHIEPGTGEVVEVRRRPVGRLASAPEPQPDGSLTIEDGQVVRVRKEVLGSLPPEVGRPATPEPSSDGSLMVENGVVMRVRKEVVGALPAQPLPPQPMPQASTLNLHAQASAWVAAKQSEVTAIIGLLLAALFSDQLTKHRRVEEARLRLLLLAPEANAWARALGHPEPLPIAQLSRPTPLPAGAPALSSWQWGTPSYTRGW